MTIITKEDEALMRELRSAGLTARDIAEKFEVSVNAVYVHTRRKRQDNEITLTMLRAMYEKFDEITEEKVVTHRGQVIGRFIPENSAH